jgi:hypothetical protein
LRKEKEKGFDSMQINSEFISNENESRDENVMNKEFKQDEK